MTTDTVAYRALLRLMAAKRIAEARGDLVAAYALTNRIAAASRALQD